MERELDLLLSNRTVRPRVGVQVDGFASGQGKVDTQVAILPTIPWAQVRLLLGEIHHDNSKRLEQALRWPPPALLQDPAGGLQRLGRAGGVGEDLQGLLQDPLQSPQDSDPHRHPPGPSTSTSTPGP